MFVYVYIRHTHTYKPTTPTNTQVLDLFEALSERGVRLRASSFNVLMEELASVRIDSTRSVLSYPKG